MNPTPIRGKQAIERNGSKSQSKDSIKVPKLIYYVIFDSVFAKVNVSTFDPTRSIRHADGERAPSHQSS